MTATELQAQANEIQAIIEADLRAQGHDPAMGDHWHPLNEAWKCLQADIDEATR